MQFPRISTLATAASLMDVPNAQSLQVVQEKETKPRLVPQTQIHHLEHTIIYPT